MTSEACLAFETVFDLMTGGGHVIIIVGYICLYIG